MENIDTELPTSLNETIEEDLSENSKFELSSIEHIDTEYDTYSENSVYWVTALYPYEAQHTEELSFNEGDVIAITQQTESGWSRGILNGVEGAFPSSYVQEFTNYIPEEEIVHDNEEQARKRRERKEHLKNEMKFVKEELKDAKHSREILEAEIKLLTESKQKLARNLIQRKAILPDKLSLLYDLFKLILGTEIMSDSIGELQNHALNSYESLNQFSADLSKEVKASYVLTSLNQKLQPKMKDVLSYLQTTSNLLQECDRLGKDFVEDVSVLTKIVGSLPQQ